ncbi:MAG: type IV pilin N-terminal domain-containing protein [Candidatus Poseidoniaceae archaeon]|nr:type IV pilin N-terminal domain-containing protein [Candidatus Poseidoniaceae archaeon]MBL6888865.1 type IV pilin N-terminal domain-containing protein [Candidatus Poseidoniaceae archaeon]
MANLRSDEEAVSPVIATVLLLAITVMLSGMVFVLMQGALETGEKAPPQMTVSVRSLDNGYHVIRITTLDQTLDPGRISFSLDEQNNANGTEFTGFVDDSDVYSVIGSNVSFHDRDASYSISAGDYFVINSREIGTDVGDWGFTLLDQELQYVLVRIDLPPMQS